MLTCRITERAWERRVVTGVLPRPGFTPARCLVAVLLRLLKLLIGFSEPMWRRNRRRNRRCYAAVRFARMSRHLDDDDTDAPTKTAATLSP